MQPHLDKRGRVSYISSSMFNGTVCTRRTVRSETASRASLAVLPRPNLDPRDHHSPRFSHGSRPLRSLFQARQRSDGPSYTEGKSHIKCSLRGVRYNTPSPSAMFTLTSLLGFATLCLLGQFAAAQSTSLSSIPASRLTQIFNFGTNPNNVQMFVYKPAKVATRPALIVASHCVYSHLSSCTAPLFSGW